MVNFPRELINDFQQLIHSYGTYEVPKSPDLPYQCLLNKKQKTTAQERYRYGSGMEVFLKAPYLDICPLSPGINSVFSLFLLVVPSSNLGPGTIQIGTFE